MQDREGSCEGRRRSTLRARGSFGGRPATLRRVVTPTERGAPRLAYVLVQCGTPAVSTNSFINPCERLGTPLRDIQKNWIAINDMQFVCD